MSELINPEELEDALTELLDHLPSEPFPLEWVDEQFEIIRTNLEAMAEVTGEGAGKAHIPLDRAGVYVPRETSELSLLEASEQSQAKEVRKRRAQTEALAAESDAASTNLLGHMLTSKMDWSRVSVQPLEVTPDFNRLPKQEHQTKEADEDTGPQVDLSEMARAMGLGLSDGELAGPGLDETPAKDERPVKAHLESDSQLSVDLSMDPEASLDVGPAPRPAPDMTSRAFDHPSEPFDDGELPEMLRPGEPSLALDASELSMPSMPGNVPLPPPESPFAGRPEPDFRMDTAGTPTLSLHETPPPAMEMPSQEETSPMSDSPTMLTLEGLSMAPGLEPGAPGAGPSFPHFGLDLSEPGAGGTDLESDESMDALSAGPGREVADGRPEVESGDQDEGGEADEVPARARKAEPPTSCELPGIPEDRSVEAPTPVMDLPEMHAERYKARARIGAGAQGVVTEVRDRYLAREVALKVLRTELNDDPHAVYRFWREAQITGQLCHSGVVPIYDVGILPDNAPYFTMRRVRGITVRTILRRLRRIAEGKGDVVVREDQDIEPEVYAWEIGEKEAVTAPGGGVGGKPGESGTEKPLTEVSAGSTNKGGEVTPDGGESTTDGGEGTTDGGEGNSDGEAKAAGHSDAKKEGAPLTFEKVYTRRKLLSILTAACHTLGYAHDRGVIHRDLKPGNLMVASYGEVLVLDWGMARILGTAAPNSVEGPVLLDEHDTESSQSGRERGTPMYMAPEQLAGDVDAQGPWTDVFSLGTVLYEILTGLPARSTSMARDSLRMSEEGTIDPPEERRQRQELPVAPIPEELERICMKCLERDPKARFENAEALANDLSSYLGGEQRREIAEERARLAEEKVALIEEIDDEIALLKEESDAIQKSVQPWMELAKKRRLWAKEDKVRSTQTKREETLAEAFELYTQALGDDPDNRRARKGLSRLYYEQLLEAENWGRTKEARRLVSELKRVNDGTLSSSLRGYGVLELSSEPSNAQAWLYDLRVRDRQLQPAEGRLLGNVPLSARVEMGSYLVELRWGEGARARTLKYPVRIRRQDKWEGHLRLPEKLPEGYVFVPASRFLFGGDREAPGAGPRQELWVDDFVIAQYPVTCGEYLEFLLTLEKKNPKDAAKRVPRFPGPGGGEPLWPHTPGVGFRIPGVDAHGGRWAPNMPLRCVSREDAVIYSLWLSTKTGLPMRLPTEFEWEKAGRGVDGRYFPWGNEFDASFCNMKDSQAGAPELMPVGTFELDCSPYGVRDMAGGVIEWCSGPFNRDGVLGIQKGGFWLASQNNCRLARRFGVFPTDPEKFCGFRVAYTPTD